MREIRPYGSVRGVAGDRYPYRDQYHPTGLPFTGILITRRETKSHGGRVPARSATTNFP